MRFPLKIRHRIVELRRVLARDLIPNPRNWRTHPKAQQEAMQGILAEIGYADALLARETPAGLQIIDGHILGNLKDLAGCTPQYLRRALGRLKGGEASARTSNLHRSATRTFFAWLIREGRWSSNPADRIAPASAAEPARRRRALLPEEETRLLQTAPSARALVYLVALRTGLRRGELAKLVWNDLDLDAETIRVRASIAKNRREAILPLPHDAAAALSAAFDARRDVDGTARVFGAVPVIRTFRIDLAAARDAWIKEADDDAAERRRREKNRDFLAYEDSDGRFLDFHALRVTFGTALARAGVRLQTAQRLLRHSTPVLTANVYTKLELHDLRGAVERLGGTHQQLTETARRRA